MEVVTKKQNPEVWQLEKYQLQNFCLLCACLWEAEHKTRRCLRWSGAVAVLLSLASAGEETKYNITGFCLIRVEVVEIKSISAT